MYKLESCPSCLIKYQIHDLTSGQQVAKERQISLNALLQESLAATVRAEQLRRLFDDFTQLGDDAAACDVDSAFPLAAEIFLPAASE